MMSGNPSSWWSGNNSMQNLMRTPSTHDQQEQTPPHDRPTHPPSLLSQQHQQQTTTSILFPSIQHDDQYVVHASSDDAPPPTDLHDGYHNHATAPHHQFPMSWSQLLLGGLVNEEERYGTPQSAGHDQINQSRKLIENCSSWETQQYLNNITTTTTSPMPNIDQADHHLHIKQEGTQPLSGNTLLYNHHHLDHQDHRQDINVHEADQGAAAGATSYNRLLTTNWPPHIISPPSSSPKSCVTSSLSSSSTTNNAAAINNNNNSNILDFSNNKSSLGYDDDQKNIQHADHSYECNSSAATTTGSGAATKKARVQPSSTPPLKVRKEKLGDRITALHQLVSPFGKTDTASVLLEAIGYIRFLQGQIEQALSSPYLSNSPAKAHQQQSAHAGERNCLFPDHPGQLLNDSCLKRRGAADSKDYNNKGAKDLKSRGLCLVPISYTHMVGNDNGADYWAPSFGGGF